MHRGGLRRNDRVVCGLVIAVEAYSSVVHPLPVDFKGTSEEMCLHVARYRPGYWQQLFRVGGHGVRRHVDRRLLRKPVLPLFIGLILIAAVILQSLDASLPDLVQDLDLARNPGRRRIGRSGG